MPPKKTKTYWPTNKKKFEEAQILTDDNKWLRIRTKIMKGPLKCSPDGMI